MTMLNFQEEGNLGDWEIRSKKIWECESAKEAGMKGGDCPRCRE
jgi:hypothetical protein